MRESQKAWMQYLSQITYGRSVALVGNSDYTDVVEVAKCDFVIKCNLHGLSSPGRCAGAVVNGEQAPLVRACPFLFLLYDVSREYAPQWKRWAAKQQLLHIPYTSECYAETPKELAHLDWSISLSRKLGTTPFTGIFALEFLRQFQFSRIYLTGFNFFAKDGVIPLSKYGHQIYPQFSYLVQLADDRLDGDAVLRKVLYLDGYRFEDERDRKDWQTMR